MNKKVKLGVALALMAGALVYLITAGVSKSAAYYMTVDEVTAQADKFLGKAVRVNGLIDARTVHWDAANLYLAFEITGEKGRLKIEQKGRLKPDNMNDQWEAIVEGRLTDAGVITANQVLIKCPSRYESEVVPADHPSVDGKPHPGTDPNAKHPPVNTGGQKK